MNFENTECDATITQWTAGAAYFARVVIYTRNMFMKWVNAIKLFTAVIYDFS